MLPIRSAVSVFDNAGAMGALLDTAALRGTINYGHVLTALSIIVAGTGAYPPRSPRLRNPDQLRRGKRYRQCAR